MTAFVLDASSLLAWCFEDEGGPEADALIEKVAAEGAAVPALRSLEIAGGLVMGECRGRLTRLRPSSPSRRPIRRTLTQDTAGVAACGFAGDR